MSIEINTMWLEEMKEMRELHLGLLFGISAGFVIGVLLVVPLLFCTRCRSFRQVVKKIPPEMALVPIRVKKVDSSTILSGSGLESPRTSDWIDMPLWLEGLSSKTVVSACGVPKYSYKDLRKATCGFTTAIGQGAFGSVYKAQMTSGETFAVKVLATDSKQGEKDFLTEVLLLGRLHHRNLVNLVGYASEKEHHMLVYVYMSNGSLASHLYGENPKILSWSLRVLIALDVARGLEYLHYGAVPPVVHRDIKSSNILLDMSMRARVSDFGLSRHEAINPHSSNVKGTLGYLDPEYISSNTFTRKSDVYSFGVLLFELLAGRNPQQGLLEYVELAAMDTEGEVGWEEIVDSRLDGKFDATELNGMASLAYKCINRISRLRPSMRDTVHVLAQITNPRKKPYRETLSVTAEEVCIDMVMQQNDDDENASRHGRKHHN